MIMLNLRSSLRQSSLHFSMALLCVNDIEFLYNVIHNRYLRINSISCAASQFTIGPIAQSMLGISLYSVSRNKLASRLYVITASQDTRTSASYCIARLNALESMRKELELWVRRPPLSLK
jgi:hypothetical protein